MPMERQQLVFTALGSVATAIGTVVAVLLYLDSRPASPSSADPITTHSTNATTGKTVEGTWNATDVGDRSQITLRVTKTGSAYNVAMDDKLASAFCKTTGATVTWKGTLTGNKLSMFDGRLICYDGRSLGETLSTSMTFQPDTDTLTEDGTNTLYTRDQ
ncbi:hypothetical protein [Catellatospora citrea]|uniref:Uncharacterized protein n=1 Tax=Catellatospora citrea TaxID=53366 RepID=A0A8J3KHT2_9ACTN|nr:hypothetical protein [Catellatospora citrea]RKE05447.1 hypothetical protein C8E86_0243 [Catellatospora citrea]GIG00118.1 hypothetical protein Cci01nite_52110 [Catellatospora citrea]